MRPKNTTLYLEPEVREEIRKEAKRLDRSISWIMQTAWRLARERIKAVPSPWSTT